MSRTTFVLFLLGSCCVSRPASAVTIDWTTVGDPGNAANPFDNTGAVPYTYEIDKYDVTNGQYAEFLNTKDPAGANALGMYNPLMGSDVTAGGISFDSAAPAGSKYVVIAERTNWPVTYVSWNDAARFANWLNNGQGNADTEDGAYKFGPSGNNGAPVVTNIAHIPGSTVYLPTLDEWIKAGYYDPGTGLYNSYPTSSNIEPTASLPPGAPNSANYQGIVGHPTDVGAYTTTSSHYGTFDQFGNVSEWNESYGYGYGGLRMERGLPYDSTGTLSGQSSLLNPSYSFNDVGFRVVGSLQKTVVGDVNFDGIVNTQDIAQLASNWLHTPTVNNVWNGDVNQDGIVNGQDIAVIASHWLWTLSGPPSGGMAVPEPSAFILAALGGLALLAYRRRR